MSILDAKDGVHIIRGSDGFAVYCERCDREIGRIRQTLQAAVCDRIMHVHTN